MNRKQILFGLAVFALFSCFIVDFTGSEVNWLWANKTEIPIGLGLLSLLFFVLYYREVSV